jgi:hypothetical protein
MYKTISEYTFASEMSEEGNGFSYEGAKMLLEYLTALEEDAGVEMEFDPVALRCEYSENTLEEYKNEYPEMVNDFIEEESSIFDDEEFLDYAQMK